jgi:hypothetical protein
MKYAINAAPDFLRVEVSGRDTDQPPSHMCTAVYEATVKHDCLRVLIELDQKIPLSPSSQYQLVEALPGIGFTPRHSLALVHRTPIAQMASKFIDKVAANQGLEVRTFPDVAEAEAWLHRRPA